MKKSWKRILALALAVVLVLGTTVYMSDYTLKATDGDGQQVTQQEMDNQTDTIDLSADNNEEGGDSSEQIDIGSSNEDNPADNPENEKPKNPNANENSQSNNGLHKGQNKDKQDPDSSADINMSEDNPSDDGDKADEDVTGEDEDPESLKDDSEKEEEEKEVAHPAATKTARAGIAMVTLSADEGALPEGWTVSVTEDSYKNNGLGSIAPGHKAKKLKEKVEKGKIKLEKALIYDITILDADGNKIEPDKNVTVSIENSEIEGEGLEIYHITDDGDVEEVQGTIEDGVATFKAESFSSYAITFTNSNPTSNDISIKDKTVTINIGDTLVITGTASKANLRSDYWTVSKEGVVTVVQNGNSGKATVTAVGPGRAEVKHHYYKNKFDLSPTTESITVIVNDNEPRISIDGTDEVEILGTIKLAAKANLIKDIEWTSSDESVATVDADGLVTGVAEGKATITASGEYEGEAYYAEKQIEVISGNFVYVAVYATDGTGDGISSDMVELLGLKYKQPDGYYPVGVIKLPESFFKGKTSPYIKSEADWEKVKNAIGSIDTSYLTGKGLPNAGNTVGSHLDCVQADIGKGAGSKCTALFDWSSGEAQGAISLINNKNYKYHMDVKFSFNTLKFTSVKYEKTGGTGKVGGTGDLGSRKYLTGTTTKIPGTSADFYLTMSDTDKSNYSIEGYYSDSACTVPYQFGNHLDGDTNIYVKLIKQNITVTYILNGGKTSSFSGNEWTSGKLKMGEATPAIETPTNGGYVLSGWIDDLGNKYGPAGLPKQATRTVTYTAQWEDTLSYDANEGTGNMYPTAGEPGTVVTVSDCAFTRLGYEFTGWNTAADGTGKSYNAGDEYKLTDGEDTLYAQWETKVFGYTVNYVLNGTDGAVKVKTSKKVEAKYGDAITVKDEAVEIDGYTLVPVSKDEVLNIVEDEEHNVINIYYRKNVTVKANSDEVTYDGQLHSVTGYEVVGKVDGYDPSFDVNMNAVTEEINAGTYEVKFYKNIIDKLSNDIIGTYDDTYMITAVENGTLKINPRNITFTSGNGEKVYDGKSLENKNVEVAGDGYAPGESFTFDVTGTITNAGTANNTFTYSPAAGTKAENYNISKTEGTLKIKPVSDEVNVTITENGGSALYDGSEHTASGYTVTSISNGLYTASDFTFSGNDTVNGTDAGTYGMELKAADFANTSGNFTNVKFNIVDGSLVISPRTVTLSSASASKMYDGSALTEDTITVGGDGFAEGEGASYTVTGSQTKSGSSDNDFTYTLNEGTKAENYNISTSYGKLSVSKKNNLEILIKEHSGTFTYDGTEKTVSGYDVIIPEGSTYTENDFTFNGDDTVAKTNAGTYDMNLSAADFVNTNEDFENVTFVIEDGTLTINQIDIPIEITATSASKIYDGLPLTGGYAYTQGVLANGDVLEVSLLGSQTDAGSSKTEVAGYAVKNAAGQNVTSNYKFGDTKSGTLTVTKKAVTLTSATASKTYDGSTLTNSTVTAKGFVDGQGASYNVTGSQQDAGTSDNTFTYELNAGTDKDNYEITKIEGKLTVAPITTEIVVTAASESKPYDGIALKNAEFSYTEGILVNGDVIKAVVDGKITDYGTAVNEVKSVKVMRGETDVTGNYTIGKSVNGTLAITKRTVTLTSSDDEAVYNGKPLTNDTVTVTGDGFAFGEGYTADVTGSQLDAGSSVNEFTYKLNEGTKADNYDITKVEGTLTVTKNTKEIVITAANDSRMYNGEPLVNKGYTYTDDIIAASDTLTAVVEGSITDVGTAANTVTAYKVMRGDTDVTENYTFGTVVDGTLEITKRSVTLTSASANKAYDGEPLTNDTITVTGDGFVSGEGYTADVTGSQTDEGSSANTFSYMLNEGTREANYNISKAEGILTVNADGNEIVVTAASDSKKYDGTALENGNYTYTEGVLKKSDRLVVEIEGSITDAGEAANVVKSVKVMREDKDVTKNYTIGTPVDGKLTVNKRSVTLTSATAAKTYDGKALADSTITVTGDGFAEGEGYTAAVTGTITDLGEVENAFTYTLNENTKGDNYDITAVAGKLTVSKVETPITITADSAERMYNGEPLTGGYAYTQNVLAEGDTLNVTVEGTITDAGKKENKVTGYSVTRDGIDVTANYTFEEPVSGTLTVTKRNVTLSSGTSGKPYDGKELVNNSVTVSGDGFAANELPEYTFGGKQLEAGESDNTFSYHFAKNVKESNYVIKTEYGKLTVTPLTGVKVYITEHSDEVTYDGDSHEVTGYDVTDISTDLYEIKDFSFSGNAKVSGTNAGEYRMEIASEDFHNTNGNFADVSFIITDGTLKIKKIETPIVIKAADASKVYDGKPLFSTAVTYTEGVLAEGDKLTAEVQGTVTNAGTADNTVISHKVTNAEGDDVTANYTFGTYEKGILEVTKRPVTLTSATDSKTYDGQPLENHEVTATEYDIETAVGFIPGEGFNAEVIGSQTNVGESDNSFSYTLKENTKASNYDITKNEGTLTVSKKGNVVVTITEHSGEVTYTGSEQSVTGYDVSISDPLYTEADFAFTGNATVTGTNAGSYDMNLTAADFENKNDNFEKVTFNIVDGKLTVKPIETKLIVKADSDSKMYDGTALVNSGFTYTENVLAEGDTVSAVVEGSQTDAGTSANVVKSVSVMRGETDVTANYSIGTPVNGILEVTKREVTLTSDGAEAEYSGNPLTADNVEIGGEKFLDGQGVATTVTGSQTDVGESKNEFTYTFNEGTNPDNYNITKEEGTLKVTKPAVVTVTITEKSETKTYNGSAQSIEGYEVTSISNDLYKASDFTYSGSAVATGTYIGEYPMEVDASKFKNNNPNFDVEFTVVDGKLTIEKIAAPIIITAATDKKLYDGTALKNAGFTYTQNVLVPGDVLTATVTGAQTNAGSSDNVVTSYEITRDGENVTSNYTFGESEKGILTVEKRNVTLTSSGASKTYDGTPLTKNEVKVTEGSFADGEGYVPTVTGTITETGSVKNTYDYTLTGGAAADNYNITKIEGTLVVNKITTPIVITAASGNKMYDGTALVNAGYTFTENVLAEGDELTAVVEGTITDAGETENVVTSYAVKRDEVDVTKNYTFGESVNGSLAVGKRSVKLTSATVTKTYDGEALTDNNVTVDGDGFVEGEGAAYTVTGTQTEAGSSKNTFTYELSEGTNPDNYDIKTVEGDLIVTADSKEVVVVITGNTATETYNGQPQKAEGYEVTSISNPKFNESKISFSGTAEAERTDKGTTYMGLSEDQFSSTSTNYTKVRFVVKDGWIKINPIETSITITAASKSTTYDGTALTDAGYTYTEGVLLDGDTLTAVVEGSQTDAGTADNKVKSYAVMRGNKDVTKNYTFAPSVDGSLTVNPKAVTITSASAERTYNGNALTKNEVTASGFVGEDGITYNVTGSQTNAGESSNTFSYGLKDGTKAANYSITKNEGTLKVTPVTDEVLVKVTERSGSFEYDGTEKIVSGYDVDISNKLYAESDIAFTGNAVVRGITYGTYPMTLTPSDFSNKNTTNFTNVRFEITDGNLVISPKAAAITITAASDNKMYDGTALTNAGCTYTEGVLAEGDVLTAVVEGSITNAGTVANVVTSYKVMRGTADVTSSYTFTDSVNGSLEVTKRKVTLTSESVTKTYDGSAAQSGTVTAGGDGFVSGEGFTPTVTGSQLDVGSSDNTFSYGLNAGTLAENYDISVKYGTLKVKKIETPVTITAASDNKMYDGTALTNAGYTYNKGVLVAGDVLTAEVSGTITNAGTAANVVKSYKVMRGETDVTGNYTFGDSAEGVLTVTKRKVTLTSATDSRTYDGTPFANTDVAVGGDGFVSGEGVTTTVTGSQTAAGTIDNLFTYVPNEGTDLNNYEITPVYGTITVAERGSVVVTITEKGGEYTYDGTEKKLTGYDVSISDNLYTQNDFDFTGTAEVKGTDAGTYEMDIKASDFKNTNSNFKDVTFVVEDRQVKISPIATSITITANGAEKVYNGTELTEDGFTYTPNILVGGDVLTAETEGTITDFGEAANKVTSYKVTRGETDVTKNYTFADSADGTLKITKREVTLTSASDTKVYDGTALTNNTVTPAGFVGEDGAEYTVTGTITETGKADNEFTYTLKSGTKAKNYSIKKEKGILEVTPCTDEIIVTITEHSGSATYDGEKHEVSGYGVDIASDLYKEADIKFNGTDKVEGVNAGTYEMNLSATDFVNVSKNFSNIKFVVIPAEGGALVISPKAAVITADDATKVYGNIDPEFTGRVAGLVKEGDLGTITYTRTNADEAAGTYEAVILPQYAANSNYAVSVTKGDFEITKR